MEDPKSAQTPHPIDPVRPTRKMRGYLSGSTSPEHSRARSKKMRATDKLSYTEFGPQRRRESYADGTRRGRSQTRSVSPGSLKRRAVRRRRSRSPSRSCSTSATDMQSSGVKRQRRNQNLEKEGEDAREVQSDSGQRNQSRESMRSRSKRRKRYRRRSDYAAATADIARETDLSSLRTMASTEDANSVERAYERTEKIESVLEEDEEVGELHHGGEEPSRTTLRSESGR